MAGGNDDKRHSSLDVPSICLVRVTKDGRVSETSSAAAAMLSPSAKEPILGEFFVDWVAEEDRKKVQSALTEAMHFAAANGGRRIAKVVLSLASGPWSTILFVTICRSAAGALDGAIISLQDFNELNSFLSSSGGNANCSSNTAELKKLQEEAERARLEAAELRAELKRARQRLEQAAATSAPPISAEIQGKVMHDLRSPLTGVIGLANMLSEDESPSQKPLKMIGSSASRALENITKVMDYFNLISDPSPNTRTQKRAYDIGHLLREVVENCHGFLDRRGESIQKEEVEFIQEVDSPLVKCNWEENSMKLILSHLISNAFKFTSTGKVKLKISNDAQKEGYIIVVEDTGIGIAKGSIDRIFEAFQQEDNSQSRKYEGLGVGLTIVQYVVKKCSGTVTLESKQGHGSKFTVCMPCKPPPKPSNNEAAGTTAPATAKQAAAPATAKQPTAPPPATAKQPTAPPTAPPAAKQASAVASSASAPDAAKSQPASASTVGTAEKVPASKEPAGVTSASTPLSSTAAAPPDGALKQENARLTAELQRLTKERNAQAGQGGVLQEQNGRLTAELNRMAGERDALRQQLANASAAASAAAASAAAASAAPAPASKTAPEPCAPSASAPSAEGVSLPELPKVSIPVPLELNRQRTVVCVDDDPIHQQIMGKALNPCGFNLVICMSGMECLKYMEQGILPDIILLDLSMPGINGFDVLQAQRKKHTPDILPIVMVSADERLACVSKGFELGANDWIRKPFEKNELVARVQAHLRMKDKVAGYRAKLGKVEKVKCYVNLIDGLLHDMA